MQTEREPLPDVSGWEAQHFQLVAFPVGGVPVPVPPPRWTELTGNQPTTTQAKPFYREESGEHDHATLTVLTDLVRVAWIATPLPTAQDLTVRPPTFRPFPQSKDWFVGLMSQWLPHCPPACRLAFVAKLMRPVEGGSATARDSINRYLAPWVQVESGSSDFLYRINRPRDSRTLGLAGLKINRLSTWSAVQFVFHMQVLMLQQGTGEIAINVPPQSPQPMGQVACAVEVDISTDAQRKEALPAELLPDLFRELADLGTEIAASGDIR